MSYRAEKFLSICLVDAIADKDLDAMKVLLGRHGANPNAIVLELSIAPIHLVIGVEDCSLAEQATQMMLHYGADPNLRADEDGIAPLHIAAYLGRPRLVDMLLKAGADVDQESDEGKRPVELAVEEGHFEVVEVVRNHIFEQKFARKRQPMLQPPQQHVKCLGGYLQVDEANKNLLSVNALDMNKLSPNRVRYNFDATSPNYINITHRRNDRIQQLHKDEEEQEDEIVPSRRNLFDLTEQNLTSIKESMAGNTRRSSSIECWKSKIVALRDGESFKSIDKLELAGFSDTSVQVTSPPVQHSPHNRIEQTIEEYLHTDDEAGVVFLEKKFFAASDSENQPDLTTRIENQPDEISLTRK